jgi:hypothetical protein
LSRPSRSRPKQQDRKYGLLYYIVAEEETADGLLVTMHARREEEVFGT